jgi:hypothetical protein
MMPKYRVTVRTSSTEIVEADNEYMAAVAVATRRREDVEIADVRPAVGRAPSTNGARNTVKTSAKKATKTVKKKRRQLSPEARAKLAQNAAKARAARARKLKAAKKSSRAKKAKHR